MLKYYDEEGRGQVSGGGEMFLIHWSDFALLEGIRKSASVYIGFTISDPERLHPK